MRQTCIKSKTLARLHLRTTRVRLRGHASARVAHGYGSQPVLLDSAAEFAENLLPQPAIDRGAP